MCGIGGIFRYKLFTNRAEKEQVYRILSKLLIGLQNRGYEATGMSVINTHTDNVKVFKQVFLMIQDYSQQIRLITGESMKLVPLALQ